MNASKVFEEIRHEEVLSEEMLSGGVTNLSFEIRSSSGHYILRIPGKGTNEFINRSDEIANMRAASVLGFVPEILYSNPSSGIIISRFVENNIPMAVKDLSDPERREKIAKTLLGVHRSGITGLNEFDIVKTQEEYKQVLRAMRVSMPEELEKYIPILDRMMERLFEKYPKELVLCHGDPKLNNFLLDHEKMWLIDWEYSGMADKYFDLVNLTMTDNLSKQEETWILEAYQSLAREKIISEKYILWKIATDYLWIYWHLIKMFQGEMVEYNMQSWVKRLHRALNNTKILERFA